MGNNHGKRAYCWFIFEGRTFPVEQFFLEDAIEFTRYNGSLILFYQVQHAYKSLPENHVSYQIFHLSFRFVLEERSPFARSVHTRRQQHDVSGEIKSSNQTALPPRQKLPDQNLTVQQLFQRYPGMCYKVLLIKFEFKFHNMNVCFNLLQSRNIVIVFVPVEYKKSTLKTLAMMDVEKICSDLIERLIEWIVQADHEVWLMKRANQTYFIIQFLHGNTQESILVERRNVVY